MIYAFYGSLRNGEYNYKRIMQGKEDVKFIGTFVLIDKLIMYDLGFYPMIIEDKTKNPRELVVDLFDIDNKQVSSIIDGMERGAGYVKKEIEVKGYKAALWIGNPRDTSMVEYIEKNYPIVESGDWLDKTKKTPVIL